MGWSQPPRLGFGEAPETKTDCDSTSLWGEVFCPQSRPTRDQRPSLRLQGHKQRTGSWQPGLPESQGRGLHLNLAPRAVHAVSRTAVGVQDFYGENTSCSLTLLSGTRGDATTASSQSESMRNSAHHNLGFRPKSHGEKTPPTFVPQWLSLLGVSGAPLLGAAHPPPPSAPQPLLTASGLSPTPGPEKPQPGFFRMTPRWSHDTPGCRMWGLEHMMQATVGRDGAAGGGSSNLNWRLLPPELPTGSPAPHKGLIHREVTSVPRGGRERKGGRPGPPGPFFSGEWGAVCSYQGQGRGSSCPGGSG